MPVSKYYWTSKLGCFSKTQNLSFHVLDRSVSMNKESTVNNVLKVKMLFIKNKLNKVSLIYPYITDMNDLKLVLYTDTLYANPSDGYSHI